MLIKKDEFDRSKYAGIEIISNTDSGLFAVEYERVSKAELPKLQPDTSWHYNQNNDYYTLTVPQPKQRNVLRSVMISRTSKNHYEIAYADALGCVFGAAKTISEVHGILKDLW